MIKLSDTQYQYYRYELGYFEEYWDGGPNWKGKDLPAYEPDSNPAHYWLCYEDSQTKVEWWDLDYDYQDVLFDVYLQPDGSAKVTMYRETGSAYAQYTDMLDPAGNVVVKGIVPGTGSDTYTMEGGLCSYGINSDSNVRKLDKMGKKILLLDYEAICSETDDGYWEYDVNTGDRDNDGTLDIARHNGRINVLYLDGSVEAKIPEEIDLQDSAIRQRLWQGD